MDVLFVGKLQLNKLCQSLNKLLDLLTEFVFYIYLIDVGAILHGIVK